MESKRLNVRVTNELNDWLDKESKSMSIPKSTLIFLAVEQYMQQKEAMRKIDSLVLLTQEVDNLKKMISMQQDNQ